jgi:hypothetical protein
VDGREGTAASLISSLGDMAAQEIRAIADLGKLWNGERQGRLVLYLLERSTGSCALK